MALPDDQNRNPEECPCKNAQPSRGRPIQTRIGNLWQRATDLSAPLAGPGPELIWSRTYNSQAITETASGLGAGWQHPFATHLLFQPTTVTMVSPAGNRLRFRVTGPNTFAAYPGVYATLTWDSLNGGTYVVRDGDGETRVFNSSGRLSDVYDDQGHGITLEYAGPGGRLSKILDIKRDYARYLTVEYHPDGYIKRVSNALGWHVDYLYTNGDLTTVTDINGRATNYTYTNHLLTGEFNALSQAVELNTYDVYTVKGKVTDQVLLDGRALHFAYSATSTIVTTTAPDGRQDVETFLYGSSNTMTGRLINGVAVESMATDDTFAPGSQTDGNGNTTSATHNVMGLPETITNALGDALSIDYDTAYRPIAVTDTLGRKTTLKYDTYGHIVRYTAGIAPATPLGVTTIYTYSVQYPERLVKEQSPLGIITSYTYDDWGNPKTVTISQGTSTVETRSFTYTPFGLLTQSSLAYGSEAPRVTSYQHDNLGRVVTTTVELGTPMQRIDLTRYNADNTVRETVKNYKLGGTAATENITTRYGYDALGRQTWVRDALGRYDVTHYDYSGHIDWEVRNLKPATLDAQGQLLVPATPPAYGSQGNDSNVATFYQFDSLGRTILVTETGLLSGPLSWPGDVLVTKTEYDQLSRPVTVTLNPTADGVVTADRNRRTITRYDRAGNVIGKRDAVNRWTYTEYDALNRPVTVTRNYENGNPATVDAANAAWATVGDTDIKTVTHYGHDGQVDWFIENYVNGVFNDEGAQSAPVDDRKTSYGYTPLGWLQTTTVNVDPANPSRTDANVVNETQYDAFGRPIAFKDPLGRWVNQQYDVFGRVTVTTLNCRTAAGAPASQNCATYAQTNRVDRNIRETTTYDVAGRVTDSQRTLGPVTHTTYDAQGRTRAIIENYVPSAPTTPLTNVTTLIGYTVFGQTAVVTDPMGMVTRYTYDALGRLKTTVDDRATVTNAYDALGNLITVTDSVRGIARSTYDGQGRLLATTPHGGPTTHYGLDRLGRITGENRAPVEDPIVARPDENITTATTYDLAGRRFTVRDPNQRTTRFIYDLRDRLIAVVENVATPTCALAPCDVTTRYEYDRAGNRTAIVDAREYRRTSAYDALGRKVKSIDALSQVTAWSYDRLGRVTFQDDPRGPSFDVTSTYDELDRISEVLATNLSPIRTKYNVLGQRVELKDGSGTTAFGYDPLQRLSRVIEPTGMVDYAYNQRGEQTSLAYPDGTVLNYAYTLDGLLDTVKQGTTTLVNYDYMASSNLLQKATRQNGAVTDYTYDSVQRLKKQTTTANAAPLASFEYQYDLAGQTRVVTESLPLVGAQPTFTTMITSSAGYTPFGLATGDFNGDGKLDIATANSEYTSVSVLLGSAGGSFLAAVPYTVGVQPRGIKAGDLNNDGKLDLVVTNRASNSVSVLRGKGDGTFQTQTTTAVGTYPYALTLGDFNRDGKLDAAVANQNSNNLTILIGDGTGALTPQATQPTIAVGTKPLGVTTGDLNRDGKLDLVVANNASTNLSVLLGQGNGTFVAQPVVLMSASPNAVVLGDLNRDGILDAAVAGAVSQVAVLFGTGTGGFQAPVPYSAGNNTVDIAANDVNGDGAPDLAATNWSGGTVNLLINNGAGAFVAHPTVYTVGGQTGSVLLEDVTSDGKADIIATSWLGNGIKVIRNITPSGDSAGTPVTLGSANLSSTLTTPFATVSADFNGDGIPDLAATKSEYSDVYIMLGSGSGTFPTVTSVVVGVSGRPRGLIAGDFNTDGKQDLVVANRSNSLNVLLGQGNGTFLVQAPITVGSEPYGMATGDINRDGKLDLAVVNRVGNTLGVLLGKGDGTFQAQVIAASTNAAQSVALADLNGDGYLDAVVGNAGANTVSVLKGNGTTTFVEQTVLSTNNGATAVVVGDFNRDGKVDIAVTEQTFCCSAGAVRVFKRLDNWFFDAGTTYATSANPVSLAVGDLNRDGASDLVVSTWNGGNVGVLINTGTGVFRPQTTKAIGAQTNSAIIADFNRDGKPDVAVSSWANNAVNVFLNQTAALATTRTTYDYDGLGRLSKATDPSREFAYAYDLAGNRTGSWKNGFQQESLTYNAANQVSNAGWQYDQAGNLTADGAQTYTYDPLGRLLSSTGSNGTENYTYNGDGALIQSNVGSSYVQYVQDLSSPLSQILQVKSSSATTTYQYGLERFAASSAGVRSWVVTDRLGSVRLNLNDTAAPLGTSSYDPWGQPLLGNAPAPFGFTGEFQSNVSGLEYLRARWYNPRSGTLLGRDPFDGYATSPYSLNYYQYGYSNPVSNTDPTGRHPCELGFYQCAERMSSEQIAGWLGLMAARPNELFPENLILAEDYDWREVAQWARAWDEYQRAYDVHQALQDDIYSMAKLYYDFFVRGPAYLFPSISLPESYEVLDRLGIHVSSWCAEAAQFAAGMMAGTADSRFGPIYVPAGMRRAAPGLGETPVEPLHNYESRMPDGPPTFKSPKPTSETNIPALRLEYEGKVRALSTTAERMRVEGFSSEEIARTVHAQRRSLGEEYKDLTPLEQRELIYARNLEKYGDPLGPTIDWLVGKGKSWEQIIESATRPGGQDIIPKLIK